VAPLRSIVRDHMPSLLNIHLGSAHPGSKEKYLSLDLRKGWAESFVVSSVVSYRLAPCIVIARLVLF